MLLGWELSELPILNIRSRIYAYFQKTMFDSYNNFNLK